MPESRRVQKTRAAAACKCHSTSSLLPEMACNLRGAPFDMFRVFCAGTAFGVGLRDGVEGGLKWQTDAARARLP